MIKIPINNQQILELMQDNQKDGILVTRKEKNGTINRLYIIEEGDFVMLLNYYQYCKEYNKAIL